MGQGYGPLLWRRRGLGPDCDRQPRATGRARPG
jgi:hypothetical protein